MTVAEVEMATSVLRSSSVACHRCLHIAGRAARFRGKNPGAGFDVPAAASVPPSALGSTRKTATVISKGIRCGPAVYCCVPPVRRVSRRSVRPVRLSSRRSWRPVRRSWRRVIPLVWASASDTVSAVVGTATASVSPRTESTLRREIVSNVMLSLNTTSLDFSHGSSCDIHNAACIVREQTSKGSPRPYVGIAP